MEMKPEDFNSPLRTEMMDFISQKRACGYKYICEYHHLRRFDEFLCQKGLTDKELTKELVLAWIGRREDEMPSSQKSRVSVASLFSKFLMNNGIKAFVPPRMMCHKNPWNFRPHIFSHEEIDALMHAANHHEPVQNAPFRHLVVGQVFWVIYTCGLRAGEAANIKIGDTDLNNGVLVVKQGKFRKDRLVPMAETTTERLKEYLRRMPLKGAEDPLFPNRAGKHYNAMSLYMMFRDLLWKIRIPHGGRGKGPRLHDLRHTFAVHRLEAWINEGVDLNAKLPLLSAYLGHVGIEGTQRYLRLTLGAFSAITQPLDTLFSKSRIGGKHGDN